MRAASAPGIYVGGGVRPPEVGDVIQATGTVYLRSGYIELQNEKLVNKPDIGTVLPKEKIRCHSG
jgi:hypothetical protein